MDPHIPSSPTASPNQLIIFLLFFVPLLLLLIKTRKKSSVNLPPSPWKLPIIGNLHQLGSMPHLSFHDLSLKHGPLMYLQLGSIPTVVISSSDVAREVFKFHDLAFSSRPPLYANKSLSYGFTDMAFAPYGEYWRQLRKVSMLEILSLKRVQSFRGVREKEVASLIASIKKNAASGSLTNLTELMLCFGTNISCQVIFGDTYGGGQYDVGRSKFHEIFAETLKLLGGFSIADCFPRLEWMERFTGLKKRLEKNFRELDGFYNEVIEDHLKRESKEENEVEDLVDVVLRLQKDPSYKNIFTTMDNIKGLMTNMFIGGADTTSTTIVWTMAELMKNPEVMSKVQEELHTFIKDKVLIEESDLQQLVYIKLIIREALRLHPPAPLLLPRETIEECSINGYTIPSGTRVFINAKTISTDPKIWKDPTKFNPDRYLDNNIDFRGQDFELIPFGFGRRSCPGLNFGIMVFELALANLLYCFNWELPKGMGIEDLDMEEEFGLTMPKKSPLRLVAKAK